MAAGVSLDRAVEVIGHTRGTHTWEIVKALQALGIACAGKLKRMPRKRPVLPPRCVVSICRPASEQRAARGHWMLFWDGEVLDPGACWPDFYRDWEITSYLEIYS